MAVLASGGGEHREDAPPPSLGPPGAGRDPFSSIILSELAINYARPSHHGGKSIATMSFLTTPSSGHCGLECWRARGREGARKHSRSLAPAVEPFASTTRGLGAILPRHPPYSFLTAHFWRAICPWVELRLSGTPVMHCPQTSRLCQDWRLGTLDPLGVASPRQGRACRQLQAIPPAAGDHVVGCSGWCEFSQVCLCVSKQPEASRNNW